MNLNIFLFKSVIIFFHWFPNFNIFKCVSIYFKKLYLLLHNRMQKYCYFSVFPKKTDRKHVFTQIRQAHAHQDTLGRPPSFGFSHVDVTKCICALQRRVEARVEQNARAGRRASQKVRGRESPRNDRFEVNEEGRDSEGWATSGRMQLRGAVVAVDNGGGDQVNDNGSPRDMARIRKIGLREETLVSDLLTVPDRCDRVYEFRQEVQLSSRIIPTDPSDSFATNQIYLRVNLLLVYRWVTLFTSFARHA